MGHLSDQFARQMHVTPPKWKRFCTVPLILVACCLTLSVSFAGYGIYSSLTSGSEPADTPVVADATAKKTPDVAPAVKTAAKPAAEPRVTVALTQTQAHLARYFSRGYRVSYDHAARIVSYAVRVGEQHNVDPLLVLSIVAVESSLNPRAESSVGAQGLMQVHTRVHTDKFAAHGGAEAAFDPYANMDVGTQIIKGYIKRTGSVVGGLKWYVGASRHKTDGGYGRRVLLEKSRITLAAQGKVEHAIELLRRQGQGPGYWDSRAAKQASFADYAQIDLQSAPSRVAELEPNVTKRATP